jgi:hypothetical protein
MDMWQAIGWGCLGGALPDVLRLIKYRHDGPPHYVWSGFFWAAFCLLLFLGGLASFLLHPDRTIDAIAIGFSAPEIFAKAAGEKAIKKVRVKKRQVTHDTLSRLEYSRGLETEELPLSPMQLIRDWWSR